MNSMKKIILFMLSLICGLIAHSQDSKVLIGVEATPTLAWLHYNPSIGTKDIRIGFSTGMTFEYIVVPHISIKSGLMYELKGMSTSIELTDESGSPMGNATFKANFNYLILPALASFSTRGKLKFYINAGPFLGILIGRKNITSGGSFSPISSDLYSETKKLDFGISIGPGIYIPLGNKLLFDLGFEENLGLLNTYKGNLNSSNKVKTNSFGFQLGLKYKI